MVVFNKNTNKVLIVNGIINWSLSGCCSGYDTISAPLKGELSSVSETEGSVPISTH